MTCPRTITITIYLDNGPAVNGSDARDVYVMESYFSNGDICLNPGTTIDITNSIGRFDAPNKVPVTLGPIDVSSCATNFSIIMIETGGAGTDTYGTYPLAELVCPSQPPCTLPYGEWKYRTRFNVTDTSGSGLADYWVPIDLSTKTFNYAKANASGADLRFTEEDQTTRLNYSIETWNTSGDSTVWVKLNVSPNSTETFFMHYGNPCVGSESIAGNYSSPPPTVNLGEEEANHVRTDYFGGTVGIAAMTNTTVSDGDVVLTGSYDLAGNVTSTIISLGDRNSWNRFYANHSLSANTGIGYQVRAINGSTLCTITAAESQAAGGYDISTCAGSISPIVLYANLSTTDGLSTPYLQQWSVSLQ